MKFGCQQNASFAIRAFAAALTDQAVDGRVSLSAIQRLCEVLSHAQGPLLRHFENADQDCAAQFSLEQEARQRANYLGRIVVKTFSHLLGDSGTGIDRKHLQPFLGAVEMVLGEVRYTELQDRCKAIIDTIPRKGRLIPWDEFFLHPEALIVLEEIQISLARTFANFEARKDWFLIVMNSTHADQSASSQTRKPLDFGESQLVSLLSGVFASVRPSEMTDQAKTEFLSRRGVSVEATFGPLCDMLYGQANP